MIPLSEISIGPDENKSEIKQDGEVSVARTSFVIAVKQNTDTMISYRNIHVFKYICLLLLLGILYTLLLVIDELARNKKWILQRFGISFYVFIFTGPSLMQAFYRETTRPWYRDMIFGSTFAILVFLWALTDKLLFDYHYFQEGVTFTFAIAVYLPAVCFEASVNLKWLNICICGFFVGGIITQMTFRLVPLLISPVITSLEAIMLRVIRQCWFGHVNPYGPRWHNSLFCFQVESFKNISLAKVVISATISGRWTNVVLFGVIASFSQCYAQSELRFWLKEKLFGRYEDERSTLYLRSYYAYQWFAQKIVPLNGAFFCFWSQVIGVKYNTFMAAYCKYWLVILVISFVIEFCTETLIYITRIVLPRFEVVLFEPRIQFALKSFTIPSTFSFTEVALLGSAIGGTAHALVLVFVYKL